MWDTEEDEHRMVFRDEQQVVLEGDTVLAHLLLRGPVLGKGRTPSVELLLLCVGDDTPDPHRVVVDVGDQCLRVHILELGDRRSEFFCKLDPVSYPKILYISTSLGVNTW